MKTKEELLDHLADLEDEATPYAVMRQISAMVGENSEHDPEFSRLAQEALDVIRQLRAMDVSIEEIKEYAPAAADAYVSALEKTMGKKRTLQ